MDKEDEKRIAALEAQIENVVATKDDLQSTRLWLVSAAATFLSILVIALLSIVAQVFLHFSDKT